jgi:hypothetical protein
MFHTWHSWWEDYGDDDNRYICGSWRGRGVTIGTFPGQPELYFNYVKN